MGREIRIVGGGLAGLTLGILLRRDRIPVRIHEAGTYPRRRVCGEFISGRGLEVLRSLNVPNLRSVSASAQAATVRFFNGNHCSAVLDLPEPALSIDRALLDEQLAREFENKGGTLHTNSRWTEPLATEGVVRATGRRLEAAGSNGLVGVKAHARNVTLSADLELHFSGAGYVGLSRQPKGAVNVCALFKDRARLRAARVSTPHNFFELFTRQMGDPLAARLCSAKFEPSTFAAVAGVSLDHRCADSTEECRIGDSICMIPPMTGNGMSIALESASIAARYIREYSNHGADWSETRHQISRACDRTFARRLTAAGLLQQICFRRAGRTLLMCAVRNVPGALRCGFRLTR